jgi:hypothetical protein
MEVDREPGRALRGRAAMRLAIAIGDISVGLRAASAEDLALPPEMEAFRVAVSPHASVRERTPDVAGSELRCDIEIGVERVPRLESATGRRIFNSGGVWTAHEGSAGVTFDFTAPVFGREPYKRLCVDRSFRQASLFLNGRCYPRGVFPLEYPADELLIMHRLAADNGVEFHACGLVDAESGGHLFLGQSGAGKSTTARLWNSIRAVRILSDDRIIVRQGRGTKAALAFPTTSPSDIRMYGTPWHGEAEFALPEQAAVSRILILEHGPTNRLQPLSKGRAVAEMFARCFVPFYSRDHLEATLACLNEIADALPCYRFEFTPTPSAVEMVLDFHD